MEANGGGKAEKTRCAPAKTPRHQEKMLSRTSEASKFLKIKDRCRKRTSFLSANERNSGPKSGKKQLLCVFEPEIATRQAPLGARYAGLEKTPKHGRLMSCANPPVLTFCAVYPKGGWTEGRLDFARRRRVGIYWRAT